MDNPTIRVITDAEEFRSLGGVWDDLLQECGDDNSIYLTHEWLFTWWQHFGEGKELNILLVEREHHVIAIVPLMKTEHQILLLRVRVLETIGATNDNHIGIMPPDNRRDALAALVSYLKETLGGNLVLRLNLVPDDSQVLEDLRSHVALVPSDLLTHSRTMTLAPYVVLPETWEEYFRSLRRSSREGFRWEWRRLERSHTVELKEHTAASLSEGLSQFFDIHRRRWQSVNMQSVFSNPTMQKFYREVSRHLLKRGWLHFSSLMVDGRVASANWGFVYNRKLYGVTVARDISCAKYSVGHVHTMYLIKEAIRRQLREYDLLQGEEPYKFRWTKRARRYVRVTVVKQARGASLRLKYADAFLLIETILHYGLTMSFRFYMTKRGWQKENKRLRLTRPG